MAGEWQTTRLGDVIELKRGYDLPAAERHRGDVPIVTSSGKNGFHSRAMVSGPGVVTGRYGTIGEVFFITEDFWPLNTTLYVRDFKGSDPRFVSYFLKTLDFWAYSDKAAVPGVNRNDLHRAEVRWPSRAEQLLIAELLGALDDKIELNRQVAETLEATAGALFKSWFVDFDPVRAKIEARVSQLPSDLTALFPARLTDDGLPEGWRLSRLGDLIELAYGRALPKEARHPGDIPVYGSGGENGFHDTSLVTGPGIVVGRKGTVGSLFWVPHDFFPIDTVFYVKPRRTESLEYLWHLLQRLGLATMNTDAAVPGLNRENAYRLAVIDPGSVLVEAFTSRAKVIQGCRESLLGENITLSALRDALLPKLISGEMRVSDAEHAVMAVA